MRAFEVPVSPQACSLGSILRLILRTYIWSLLLIPVHLSVCGFRPEPLLGLQIAIIEGYLITGFGSLAGGRGLLCSLGSPAHEST